MVNSEKLTEQDKDATTIFFQTLYKAHSDDHRAQSV